MIISESKIEKGARELERWKVREIEGERDRGRGRERESVELKPWLGEVL